MLRPVLLLLTLWAATLLLLLVVVRGPGRWYRQVTLHVRPGAPEPTEIGVLLLGWRNALLLVVVGVWTVASTLAALGPGDEELYEKSVLAVGLVPDDEFDTERFTSELTVLIQMPVVVRDVSPDNPYPDEPDQVRLEVRALSPTERLAGREDVESEAGAAACVGWTQSYGAEGTLIGERTVDEGPCDD